MNGWNGPRVSKSLDRAQAVAFATWCALHLEKLMLVFSDPARQDILRGWLRSLRVLSARGDGQAALRLRAEIDGSTEANCDDSNSPAFYAMRALSVASYAADAWNAEDPAQCARWASEECLDLIRDLQLGADSALPLVALEADAQRRLLARLATVPQLGVGDSEIWDMTLVDPLEDLAEEYVERRGWRPAT